MDEITITDIFNELYTTQSMDKSVIRKLLLNLPLDEKGELLLHKYKFETLNKPVVTVVCRGYNINP